MSVEKNYHFGKANEGPGQGFNDAGLDKFRKSKSLYAEGEQNVCDNADEKVNEPATIIFSKQEMKLSTFGINKNFKDIFLRAEERNKVLGDKQDSRDFYKKGKKLLNKDKVSVLKISDFNTTGLYRSPYDPKSNFYRLLIARGSSSQSGRGGGSHGHGQNAPFVHSALRTVFYYSYVEKGIQETPYNQLYIGKTILNEWIDKNNQRRQAIGYYGNVNKELRKEKGIVSPLFDNDIPADIVRDQKKTGLDIYILADTLSPQWRNTAIRESIKNYYAAIDYKLLKIGIKNQDGNIDYIDHNTIDNYIADKNLSVKYQLEALRDPINGKPFVKEIQHLGKVKLFINMQEGANKQVHLMRRPRMKVKEYSKPTLSNYAGVMLVDDKEGNENMRLLENANHDKLENFRQKERFGDDASIIQDLDGFLDETLQKLREIEGKKPFTLTGLGATFPDVNASDNSGESSGEDKEPDKTRLPENLDISMSPKVSLSPQKLSARLKLGSGKNGRGGGGSGSGGGSGGGHGGSGGPDDGGGVSAADGVSVRTFHCGMDDGKHRYRSVVNVTKDCEGWIGYIAFGIDNVNEKIKISNFNYDSSYKTYPAPSIEYNRINFSELKKGERFSFTFCSDLMAKTSIITEN